ncbi:MAG: hypothetical protein LBC04_01135 [Holosporaceae bacterium]|nr:hypothetical protein [Holosporaceae bacterium]
MKKTIKITTMMILLAAVSGYAGGATPDLEVLKSKPTFPYEFGSGRFAPDRILCVMDRQGGKSSRGNSGRRYSEDSWIQTRAKITYQGRYRVRSSVESVLCQFCKRSRRIRPSYPRRG